MPIRFVFNTFLEFRLQTGAGIGTQNSDLLLVVVAINEFHESRVPVKLEINSKEKTRLSEGFELQKHSKYCFAIRIENSKRFTENY